MKLSDALYGIQKVIETEGNLDNLNRLIITKNEFKIVMNGNVYDVNDYEKLLSN